MSSQDIFLPDLPFPDVIELLDYEAILAELKRQFNALQPNLINENGKAVVLAAELIELTNGEKFWKVPFNKEAGLFYLNLESDPDVRLLEISAYRELLLRQRVNDASLAVFAAYAKGNDQDELFKIFGLQRLLIKEATDKEPAIYESDEEFRRRYALALDKFTTAGSEKSYEYHGLSSHAQVKDISVVSPAPTESNVNVLSRIDNGFSNDDLLNAVESTLREIRPNSELVHVRSAEIIEYEINISVIFNYGPSPNPVIAQIQNNLKAYVDKYHRLGADIEQSAISAESHLAGVHRVEFNMNLPIRCERHQAPFCTNINVSFGGRDE